ncbi:MAG: hypothetical protein EPN64_04490 [Burkholderiaceae bacterium]|nr:MAG: hypothetical protein EPN64_04490 [Burkholderiaceae bacterium]
MRFQAKHPQQLFEEIGGNLFHELLTASGAGKEKFRAQYLPVAERLAMVIQELPLERETFAEQGGALKFGLLSALTTLRLCDSVMFVPTATAETRMRVEPQYRFAAYCACLATVPLIVFHHLNVIVSGKPWSFLSSQPMLWDALARTGTYEVEWKPLSPSKPSAALGMLLLSGFFETGQWENIDPDAVRGMCDAINPAVIQPPGELALGKIVRLGQVKVRTAEQIRASTAFVPGGSSPTDAMVADAIKATTAENIMLEPIATPAAQSQEPEPRPIPQKIVEWANAVSHVKEMAGKDVVVLPDGTARVTVKALGHGVSVKEMYECIYSAGLVEKKEDRSVVVKARLAALFVKG